MSRGSSRAVCACIVIGATLAASACGESETAVEVPPADNASAAEPAAPALPTLPPLQPQEMSRLIDASYQHLEGPWGSIWVPAGWQSVPSTDGALLRYAYTHPESHKQHVIDLAVAELVPGAVGLGDIVTTRSQYRSSQLLPGIGPHGRPNGSPSSNLPVSTMPASVSYIGETDVFLQRTGLVAALQYGSHAYVLTCLDSDSRCDLVLSTYRPPTGG